MDEYEALDQWKQKLRQTSVAYCTADDEIKDITKDLKPLRQTVKECGLQIMELLAERQERRCDIHDIQVSLKLQNRKTKKMPNKAQIRDRCLQFTGSEDQGEAMFAFLMNPEVNHRTVLKRGKLGGTGDTIADRPQVQEELSEPGTPEFD